MKRGKIILLNGVSSSGKSTIAKELVKELPDFFHMCLDDFDIFIDRMEDRENNYLIPVETEYFFHRTIAMFSDKGVNLIVDHIIVNDSTKSDLFDVLSKYPVLLVGVHCPVEELERREQARGNRNIGQAKSQLEYVHKNEKYDVEVNTFDESIEECIRKIIEALSIMRKE